MNKLFLYGAVAVPPLLLIAGLRLYLEVVKRYRPKLYPVGIKWLKATAILVLWTTFLIFTIFAL